MKKNKIIDQLSHKPHDTATQDHREIVQQDTKQKQDMTQSTDGADTLIIHKMK
jgi:hypothetical protein